MDEYHKIKTVWLRDPETNYKRLLEGQYAHSAFEYLAQNKWVFTEKVDGTSIRVMIESPRTSDESLRIKFGGKTDNASIPAFLIEKLQERFFPQKEKLFEMFPDGGCLYGEGYGAKIQKGGGNYRQDQDFALFDVRVGKFWLERSNVEDVAQNLSLDIVPIIGDGTLPEMIQKAKLGFVSQWGEFMAEGIVARPACELVTRNGDRIITKIKHRDFA